MPPRRPAAPPHPPPGSFVQRGLGPEDAPGQIVTIQGVTYVADADGNLQKVAGSAPNLEAIRLAMSDPQLGANPTGNPYKA